MTSAKTALLLAFLAAPVAVLVTESAFVPPNQQHEADPDFGRKVYVAEGCVHCHSQYVRAEADADSGLGPATTLPESLGQRPVLIGNRRQGPDLANVGLRRTAEWHRLHLNDPRSVSPGSLMPSYAHLFWSRNRARGEALVAYLESLGKPVNNSLSTVTQNLPTPVD